MEQLVNEKVDVFWKGIESGTNKRGQVTRCMFSIHDLSLPLSCVHDVQILVTFSEKKPKKSWFQVYVGEEDVPWEQWSVASFIPHSILAPRYSLTLPPQ